MSTKHPVRLFLFALLLAAIPALSQIRSRPLGSGWMFRQAGSARWYPAEVPGTVHTDLFNNRIIPDPFAGANETNVQWVDSCDWEYRLLFNPGMEYRIDTASRIVFDGLDTHADVWLNGEPVLQANNMFRQWRVRLWQRLRPGSNELLIRFRSALRHDDSLAALTTPPLAGENTRMYSRKAQYHYGWDWGPRFITCGIWKSVRLERGTALPHTSPSRSPRVRLVTRRDSIGEAFYFERDGQPLFIKGANWVPVESFLPRAQKRRLYESLLQKARDANINMLRVWGGGIYEDDLFYQLCEAYGILVWQDFMFAGALYPGDPDFIANVEAEVRYQAERLRTYSCIVLWCGNNEIEEAWFNWGWQRQYGYTVADSQRLWSAYRELFHVRIPRILAELDPIRPYWPSSPSLGWGRDSAYKKGDVHYWGVWWGKEPVERYRERTGRFVSEYGMQAFPDKKTLQRILKADEMDTTHPALRNHQKHPSGFSNIRSYITNRFHAPRRFDDLVYVSQLMQADAIGTAIAAHRRNKPVTMGTLFWQWNDCWPVVSWSAVDYYAREKALAWRLRDWYATHFLTAERTAAGIKVWMVSDSASGFPADLQLDYFDATGQRVAPRRVHSSVRIDPMRPAIIEDALPEGASLVRCRMMLRGKEAAVHVLLTDAPRDLDFRPPRIRWSLVGSDRLELQTDRFAYGVRIEIPDGVVLSDNYFHLFPGEKKIVRLGGRIDPVRIRSTLTIRSLRDTY